jgi:hypothetical protein
MGLEVDMAQAKFSCKFYWNSEFLQFISCGSTKDLKRIHQIQFSSRVTGRVSSAKYAGLAQHAEVTLSHFVTPNTPLPPQCQYNFRGKESPTRILRIYGTSGSYGKLSLALQHPEKPRETQ